MSAPAHIRRKLGSFELYPVGLGCMNVSHAYGTPPTPETGRKVVETALALGVNHFDTAALYGFGANESLVGPVLKPHRQKIMLASKCGMTGVGGKRVIDGRPETILKTCEESLTRLQTDVIDLYYLHRWDKSVPVEDSVGAMSRLVEQGKVRMLGLSEVSAATLRKAHAVHPISAVQNEYSLWSRNVEIGLLDACAELGTAMVAFSPLARGFLADLNLEPAMFADRDIRRGMPRFQEPHFSANRHLALAVRDIAEEQGCTMAQVALAWVLGKAPHIHAIPGTTSLHHLKDNIEAGTITLGTNVMAELDQLFAPAEVSGPRYPVATQAEIDTEEFAAA